MKYLIITIVVLCSLSPSMLAFSDNTNARVPTIKHLNTKRASFQREVIKPLSYSKREALSYRGSVEEYEDAIFDLESAYGPYDSEISQELIGLGLAYQESGDHQSAVSSFQRAIHLTRVNEGLYSLNQLEMIEQLIESHVALGQWEEANEQHSKLFWLNSRTFESRDPRMLSVVAKLGDWHLNSYTANISAKLYNHLLNALHMYRLAINIINNAHGEYDKGLISPLKGLTVSNYYLYRFYQQALASHADGNLSAGTQKNNVRAHMIYFGERGYRNGARAISRLVDVYDHHEDIPLITKARARIQLADWNMITDHRQVAIAMYKDVYQDLWADEGLRNDVVKNLSDPIVLPDKSFTSLNIEPVAEELSENYVLVKFDVSFRGRTSNIKVLESNPGSSKKMASEARRSLRHARFRPRIEKGEPASTKGAIHRYVFD